MKTPKIQQLTLKSLSFIVTALGGLLVTADSSQAATWKLTQTFLNPTPGDGDSFGSSLAIDGDKIAIGAYDDDTRAEDSGAVYLFDAQTGNLLQTFFNPTPNVGDQFGTSVAISGNYVLVGDYNKNLTTDSDGSGAAYLFDAQTGNLLQTFLHPNLTGAFNFGWSVDIDGDKALIGVYVDDRFAAFAYGAAYLFDVKTGNLLHRFLNPTPEFVDDFSFSVDISDNNVLIGAPGVRHEGSSSSGAAFLFDAQTGNLQQSFLNPTPFGGEYFGGRVALSGSNALIGAPGDRRDNDEPDGTAYLFDANTGNLLQSFFNPEPEPEGFGGFGRAIAIDGNTVLGGVNYNGGYLFNAKTGTLLHHFIPPTEEAGSGGFGEPVAFSDGKVLISAPYYGVPGAEFSGAVYFYEAVPEPLTLLGAGTAVAFGTVFKRKLLKKQSNHN